MTTGASEPVAECSTVAALRAAFEVGVTRPLAWRREQLAGSPQSPAGRKSLAELRRSADLVVSLLSQEAAARPSPEDIRAALDALKALAPREKERLMQELAAAAQAGGELRIVEAELVRLVAAVLDCPLPPLAEA